MKHLSDDDIRHAVEAGILNPQLADYLLGEPKESNVVWISTGRALTEHEVRSRANFSNPVDVSRKAKNAHANGFKMKLIKGGKREEKFEGLTLDNFPSEGLDIA